MNPFGLVGLNKVVPQFNFGELFGNAPVGQKIVSGLGAISNVPELGASEFVGKAHASGPSQNVAGTTTQNNPVYGPQQPYGPPAPTQTSSGGGSNQVWDDNARNAGNQIDPFQQMINDSFQPIYDYLTQTESTIKSQQPGIESDIVAQAETSKGTLGRNKDLSLSQVDTAQTGGEQRKEDALTAARRLYNELIMGGQQRFGGASTAGEAYSALAGRELMRNRQQIGTDFSSFMGQIEGARTQINTQFNNAVAELETQKNLALNQAKREFQSRLDEINRMRAQSDSDKAAQRLSVLTDLRNQIFQINMASAQSTSALNTMKSQAESEVQQYMQMATNQTQGANQGLSAFSSNTNLNPTTAYAISAPGQNQAQTMTGSISNDDDEFLRGSVTPRRDQFSFSSFA